MKKTLTILLIAIFVFTSCKFSLVSPSDDNDILHIWSPFMGVHPFASYTRVQEEHLDKLITPGRLSGVRIDANISITDLYFMTEFLDSRNVDALGIFPNEYLRHPNVLEKFRDHLEAFPTINNWEIGNEVELFISMEPEKYMPIFKKIFYFAKENYPEKNIVAEAPIGAGEGAANLKKIIDLGLKDMFNDGLTTVVIHFYSWESTRLDEFKSEISRLPANRRIWVTETNQDQFRPRWEDQIAYVNTMYQKLIDALGAERIYWYVFSTCDEFSLVKGLPDSCKLDPPLYSPLMKLLIGEP